MAVHIEVLLSTMDGGRTADEWAQRLNVPDHVALLVIDQTDARPEPARNQSSVRRRLCFAERGLSRSRNRALDAAQGELLLLADADIRYHDGAFDVVARAMERFGEAAAIRFRIHEEEATSPRRYPPRSRVLRKSDLLSVASVELALRRGALGNHRFDERFGLGAEFPSGEEALFLEGLRRRGLSIAYEGSTIVTHAGASTGQRPWGRDEARQKGALLRLMFPVSWPFVLVAMAAIRRQMYANQLSPCRFLACGVEGARRVLVTQ